MVAPAWGDAWTFDDLLDAELSDRWTYEVSDGCLVVSPRPTDRHDERAWGLHRQLAAQCGPLWQARVELSVRVGSNGRGADVGLLVPRPTVRGRIGYDPVEVGLLVEVESPSSRRTDRLVKPVEYAEAGVPFFWRLETEPRLRLHAYRLSGTSYELVRTAGRGQVPLPGPVPLVVDLDALH